MVRPSLLRTLVGVSLLGLAAPARPSATVAEGAGTPPILVELFTSQGCFSCPPADRLIARLGRESGGRVVPLVFHVDSWNSLGWRDPFSSAGWTRRHEAYVRALRAENAYTPQAVVSGIAELVGSDENQLQQAVARAAAMPRASLVLELEGVASELRARVRVSLPDDLLGRKWELFVAVYESGLVTPVNAGENKGHELHNDYVVRSLKRAARLGLQSPSRSEHSTELEIERDWKREKLGVVAFLQDRESLEIGGVASAELPRG